MRNTVWLAAAVLGATTFTAVAAGLGDAPPGATSCSGCHPAKKWVDTEVPRLNGRPADEIVSAMQAFKTGQASATVMDRIAKGFSSEEIKAIADWYASQKED
jgi:cytochrome subunit of sulfide dehydrogenase